MKYRKTQMIVGEFNVFFWKTGKKVIKMTCNNMKYRT
jgi:hypothetical protein